MSLITIKNHDTKKLSLLIFSLTFLIFLFTSDGHRFTLDEYLAEEMAYRMVTLVPDPAYVQGESKHFFNMPLFNPNNDGYLCSSGITCYPSSIFFSITQVPFVAVNHFFQIVTHDTMTLTTNDFLDQHYIYWRNSEKPDLVFMELFYGPFFSALSTVIFFLICLEYKFTQKTSIALSLLFSFTTIIWAYSNTSLNVVPTLFFILFGYLFYKKSQTNFELKFLFFSSACFGFSFLIRESSILIILPIFAMILINVVRKKVKIIPFLGFAFTLIFSYFLRLIVTSLRSIQSSDPSLGTTAIIDTGKNFIPNSTSLIQVSGLLFAPGIGLFIFSPILLTMFFSFPDFFREHKSDCILFSSIFLVSVFWFGNIGSGSWHGLNSWSARYLFLVIPFLLIPLGSSLEKRNKRFMFILIISLAILGIFFNLAYVTQDVSWFVWGQLGGSSGLYGLGVPNDICDWTCQAKESNIYIHNLTIYSFQYSQLTHSILLMLQGLHHDIYLLHLFGSIVYWALLISSISFFTYLLWRIIKGKSNIESIKQ